MKASASSLPPSSVGQTSLPIMKVETATPYVVGEVISDSLKKEITSTEKHYFIGTNHASHRVYINSAIENYTFSLINDVLVGLQVDYTYKNNIENWVCKSKYDSIKKKHSSLNTGPYKIDDNFDVQWKREDYFGQVHSNLTLLSKPPEDCHIRYKIYFDNQRYTHYLNLLTTQLDSK